MKKAIIFFLVFVAIQLAVGYTVSGVMTLLEGAPQEQNPVALIVTMAATSLATIAVFLYMKWVTVSRCYVQSRPWGVLCWCSLAAVGAIVPSMWLQEQMPELLNLVKDEFDMILRNRWGYFVIGLLAPLAEEMVFRGAVLRQLLESRAVGIILYAGACQSCSDAPCIPRRVAVGLDVLAHGQHRTCRGLSLGEQHHCLRCL